jgi:hypothetical protein
VTSSRSAVSHADIETSALTGPAIFSRVLGRFRWESDQPQERGGTGLAP